MSSSSIKAVAGGALPYITRCKRIAARMISRALRKRYAQYIPQSIDSWNTAQTLNWSGEPCKKKYTALRRSQRQCKPRTPIQMRLT